MGDERLAAFVPNAPLSEVLHAIAELYRLEWVRERGDRPTYQLIKPLSDARQEALLRERSLRGAVERLQQRARGVPPTKMEVEQSEPEYFQLLPLVLPLVEAQLPALFRDGYLYLPISRLEAPLQAQVCTLLQPPLGRHNALAKQFQARFNEMRAAEGKPPITIGGADGPPPSARDCTLIAEVRFSGQPEFWIGLRDPHDSQYAFLNAPSVDLTASGRELYGKRDLRPPLPDEMPGELAENLTRPITLPPERGVEATDWIHRLGQLSAAASLPIYADVYPDFENGMDAHPRGNFSLADRMTPAAALTAFCQASRNLGIPGRTHSFWWADQGAVLIRSARWLWDEETVLPAALLEHLADSVRATERIAPRELAELAKLSGFQVQGNGYLMGQLDSWTLAVRAPARLTPASQARVVAGGLEWAHLSPAERELLLQTLPPQENVLTPRYRAALQARPENAPGQGGTVLQTEVLTEWGGNKRSAVVHLPLPGRDQKAVPRLRALEAEKQ